MLTLTPAVINKIAAGAAVAVALLMVSVAVHDSSVARETALKDQIAGLKSAVAARDGQIKARTAELALLKHKDTVNAAIVAGREAQLQTAKTNLAEAERAIDAQAAQSQVVPLPAVHALELKADSAVASCADVNKGLQDRVDNLLAALANQDSTRAQLDSNRVDEHQVLKDTVAVLKPPWIRRALGWIGDHAVTLLTGGAIGATAVAIAKH